MGPLPRENTATPGYKRLQGHTLAQQNAIELLLQGKSDQATADALGLHRVTVTRWRNYDRAFRAALNLCRRERWAGTVDRLQALGDKALEALTDELATLFGAWRARTLDPLAACRQVLLPQAAASG
jgi:hypothetical protein